MFFGGAVVIIFSLPGAPAQTAAPKKTAKGKAKAKPKAAPGASLALKLEGKNLAEKKVALRLALSYFNLILAWLFFLSTKVPKSRRKFLLCKPFCWTSKRLKILANAALRCRSL